MEKKRICVIGGSVGLFLPITEREHHLPAGARVAIYSVSMVYCFLGVSIAADIFMSSIEAITSRRKQRKLRNGKFQTYKVWNETVANLSLMALGSSAPEIFLSVIDLLRNKFFAGDLGPSTIVGSAAFNLFVIVAVCMLAIPSNEGRVVEQVPVFIVTAVFSLLAYLWLVIVVSFISPDIVQIWEAALTFLFLPMLIFLSWKVDVFGFVGLLPGCLRPADVSEKADLDMTRANSGPMAAKTGSIRRQSIAVDMPKGKLDQKHLLIQRFTASRGATRVSRNWGAYSSSHASLVRTNTSQFSADVQGTRCAQFVVDFQSMSRGCESKPVWLTRNGDLTDELRVQYTVYAFSSPIYAPSLVRTYPHAMKQWKQMSEQPNDLTVGFKDREKVFVKDDEVVFAPSEDQKEVLIQQPMVSGCEDFAVQLVRAESSQNGKVHLGPLTYTQVKAVASGSRGILKFACERVGVVGTHESKSITVLVLRTNGSTGSMRCNYRTEAISALPDIHYMPSEGQIDFADGVTEAWIELEVLAVRPNRCPKRFVVILDRDEQDTDETTLPQFDPNCDGGEDCTILTVELESHAGSKFWRFMDWLVNLDSVHLGNSDWFNHTKSVFFVGGSLEDQRAASCIDWVFHLMALPWKLFFVFVPSVYYLGGWVCFITSLVYIALLTGVIADLADLFGCVLELRDMVTAITFVALGTSMPDLFASKGAALEDPTADASIVNVTGSNSVNVFLGLGLPWTCGAIYWEIVGRTPKWEDEYGSTVGGRIQGVAFVVEGRDLGFNVLLFSCCCIVGLVVLGLKRHVTGVELGGPAAVKYSVASLFLLLWITYIALASWRVLRVSASPEEELGVLLGAAGVVGAFTIFTVGLMMRELRRSRRASSEGAKAVVSEKSLRDSSGFSPAAGGASTNTAAFTYNEKLEAEEGPGEEGSVDIKPPLVAMEVPSGSRGRCFSKA